MSAQQQKELIRRAFEDGFNRGDYAAAEAAFAPDYVDHSPMPTPAPGLAGFKQRIERLRVAFPDHRLAVHEMLAEGDLVAFRWSYTGTDRGGFMGRPPTGAAVRLDGVNIERLENGRIAEHHSQFDTVGMLRALGVVPAAVGAGR